MPSSPETTRAVVVCESMFGNTRAIADAVAGTLRRGFDRVDVFATVSFGVTGTPRPLAEGELDEARRWAAALDFLSRLTVSA